MPATKLGVVYGTKSKLLRRIIIPDSDEELDNPLQVSAGETLVILPIDTKTDHESLHKLIGTNPDPIASRCALVHPSGNVIGAIMADPEIDSVDNHPGMKGHKIVLHREASLGWVYNSKTKTMMRNS